MKHADDGGEIETFLDNSGEILYVCTNCKKKWLGESNPLEADQLAQTQITMTVQGKPELLWNSPLNAKDF